MTISRLAAPLLIGLGALLAWAGTTDGVDSIVYYVFAIVDGIPADPVSLMKPVYNPPPMYTHAYRPLSTALVKLGGAVFGRDPEGLKWFTFAHGLLLIPYGFGARRFLRAHGFGERIALTAAALAMATPTVLFSAWTIPEFDMLGGAIILFAAAELKLGHWRRALPLLALAILTKETTAILMLAYLLGFAFLHRRERRWWFVLGAYLVALFAAVAPILMVEPPVTHEFNLSDEGFEWARVAWLAFHNGSQLFYVVGPAGAALLGFLALRRLEWQHAGWALVGLLLVRLALGPLLRTYNHYESMIFSHWGWVLFWVLLSVAALSVLMVRGSRDERLVAMAICLGWAGLLTGPVLASFSRADLSARLYAPIIPMLFGLALLAAREAWSDLRSLRTRRIVRGATGAFVAMLVWLPVAGAVSAWQFTQARFPVEQQGKRDVLAALDQPCPWVFYTNRDQELAIEELELLGKVPEDVRSCARLIQLAVTEIGPGSLWEYPMRLFGYDQYREEVETDFLEHQLRNRQPVSVPLHFYIQHARSTMGDSANAQLDADFEWATRRMPETDIGYFRQVVGVIYTDDTPIERLFEAAALYKKKRSVAFFQLPIWLGELPRRLIFGVPLVETYRYQGALYSIPKGQTPAGVPERINPPSRRKAP